MSAEKSTTDRSAMSADTASLPVLPLPPWVPRVIGAVHRFSPRAAGRLAADLWFRLPPRAAADRRTRHQPPGGEPFTVPWAGGSVSGRVFGNPGAPTAYLVHGWGGWWQQLGAFVTPLVECGFRVVAFDGPSHGDSAPGRFGAHSTSLVELAESLGAVVDAHGPAEVVVAHSVGGAATLHAQELGVEPARLVLVAPPVAMTPILRWFAGGLGLGDDAVRHLLTRAEQRVGWPLDHFDAVATARRRASHPPLLLVHDRDDVETPARGSQSLAAAWPGADLVLTEGLGHRRVLWAPEVVERVVAFVSAAADRVSPPGR